MRQRKTMNAKQRLQLADKIRRTIEKEYPLDKYIGQGTALALAMRSIFSAEEVSQLLVATR